MALPSPAATPARRLLDPWRGAPQYRPQSRRGFPRAWRGCPARAERPQSLLLRPLPPVDCGSGSSWRERKCAAVDLDFLYFVTGNRDGGTDVFGCDGAIVLGYGLADGDLSSVDPLHTREGSEHRANAVNARHAGDR